MDYTDYAFDLLSQYKCNSINDMSLVNASLRPSGKSYRDRLIAKEFNNNPSEEINDLLRDNHGFLVFQEDTIKFLTDICGFSGSLADTTRRAIGKKDKELLNEQLPKILKGYCESSKKPKEIAEKEAREFIQIIEDSSEYQFGYNHSTGYSMNGYICAMLRYYYPLEFITSYLNWADNEEDLINGTKLAKEYNIELKNCQFRYSRSKYFMDKNSNTIYKGISSIKYLNEEVGEYLYSLRDKTYDTFTDLLVDLNGHINSKQLTILIKLDFFNEFGQTGKLLKTYENFTNFYGKKQIKKDKYPWLNDIFNKYTSKETAKQFNFEDTKELLKALESQIEDVDMSITERIKAHFEFTGSCNITDKNRNRDCVILEIDKKYTPKALMYSIGSGNTQWVKIGKKIFRENPIEEFDIIYLYETSKKHKRKKVNDEWIELEEFELWANSYWKVEV